jgi:hypothetical protein
MSTGNLNGRRSLSGRLITGTAARHDVAHSLASLQPQPQPLPPAHRHGAEPARGLTSSWPGPGGAGFRLLSTDGPHPGSAPNNQAVLGPALRVLILLEYPGVSPSGSLVVLGP